MLPLKTENSKRNNMDNSSCIFRGVSLGSILFISLIIFLMVMDLALYFRVKNYSFKTSNNSLEYSNDCSEFSPFCYITVKAMMLDQINLYVMGPFVTIFDKILRISDFTLISPNMISFFHVFVALVSAKCVSSHLLSRRRIGVVLFEIRTMLDGLDGHVARTRKHIHGEFSEVGSLGYIVDGVCDTIGVIFLFIGLIIFLKKSVCRRDYLPSQMSLLEKTDHLNQQRRNALNKRLWLTLGCILAQVMVSSTAWNRYIAVYQDLLERPKVSETIAIKEHNVIQSNYFQFIAYLWRVFNIHSYLHFILLAIAYDKLWEFMKNVMFVGFVLLLCIICLSEIHILIAEEFIYGNVLFYANAILI